MNFLDEEKVQREVLDIHVKLLKKSLMRVLVVTHELTQTYLMRSKKKSADYATGKAVMSS